MNSSSVFSSKERPFRSFKPFDTFLKDNGLSRNDLKIVQTDNGSQMLAAHGQPIAAIKNELKGTSLKETHNLVLGVIQSEKGATFGIPHEGTIDNAGRPALACFMEAGGNWDTVSLFA